MIVSTRISGQLKVIAILSDRKKETVKTFIGNIPEHLRNTIKIACCDMYDGYINAVKESLGSQVDVVVDRFHVARNYNSGVDSLRKQELRRLKKELTESAYRELKVAMWALRRKENDLSEEEKVVLKKLFEYSPDLEKAYYFKDELTEIFNKNINKKEAFIFITQWIEAVKKSGLKCFDKFIKTFYNYQDEILNYFHRKERRNSGFVEGLNNKIKVIKRRCYGIFNIKSLFQRIFLDLEGYEIYGDQNL